MDKAYLEIDSEAFSQAQFHLRDSLLGVPVEQVEVGDAVAGEERAGHRTVESRCGY